MPITLEQVRDRVVWQRKIEQTQQLGSFIIGETRNRVLNVVGAEEIDAVDIDREIARQAAMQVDIWHFEKAESKSPDERSRLVGAITQGTLFELDAFFITIAPEIFADIQWARKELAGTSFADVEGDYVAVLNQRVVGSGDSEEVLRHQLAAKLGIPPGRFIVEYKGSWN